MTVTRELVSRELRCPAVAGVQSTQPFLANQLTWRLDTGGHHTLAAYAFCKGRERKRIRAIKGGSGKRPIWPKRPSKDNKGKVNLFTVGVDAAKEAIYARLKKSKASAGAMHFPLDRDAQYFEQLTAERIRTRYVKGFPQRFWWKRCRRFRPVARPRAPLFRPR